MKFTENFRLKKPSQTDHYDIEHHNDNMDGIDKALSGINNSLDNVDRTLTEVANMIYPVGSIYMSINNVNPSTLFGGVWERYAEGRTLIGVTGNAAAQATSGSATVALPNHLHTQTAHAHGMAHLHRMRGHTHTLQNHVHAVGAHTHALNDSSHAHISLYGVRHSGGNGSISVRAAHVNSGYWSAGVAGVGSTGVGISGVANSIGTRLRGATGGMSAAANTGNPTTHPASGGPNNNTTEGSRNTADSAARDSTDNSAAANTGNPTSNPAISTIQPSITCFIWRRTA